MDVKDVKRSAPSERRDLFEGETQTVSKRTKEGVWRQDFDVGEIGIKPCQNFPFARGDEGEGEGAVRMFLHLLFGVPDAFADQMGNGFSEPHANRLWRTVNQSKSASGKVTGGVVFGHFEAIIGQFDGLNPVDEKETQPLPVMSVPAEVKGVIEE